MNLEFRTLNIVVSAYFSVSLQVLYKVLTALSLAIQTARLWRGVPGRWTTGRLRQLGPSPNVNHCLWSRWTLLHFFRCVILYLVFRPTTVRLDLSRSIFVRQLWFVMNDVLWYQSIMSRKNDLPGIAKYGIIGIWTLKIQVLTRLLLAQKTK